MSFEISCHLRFYVIQDFMSFEILCVLIVTKVIVALMLKVVIKDRCVLKKWYIYLSIYPLGHHHVKSSFGANNGQS